MKQYHAFISYSHKDKEYVRTIQKSIETLGLPFYRKWMPDINLFRDERKMPLSDDLSYSIKNGLDESEYLLVIASKNSADSTWVKPEILLWHENNQDDSKFITNFNFILIDNVVEWDYINKDFDELKTTALPKFGKRIFKDVPIWANIQNYCRDGKIQTNNPNYEWEIAKIKALLLGTTPDKIIDLAAKAKRIFRIALAIVALSLAMLATFAFIQWQDAIKQKDRAEKETERATTNLRRFKLEEFEKNYRAAIIFIDADEYKFAKERLMQADSTAKDTNFNIKIPGYRKRFIDSALVVCNTKIEDEK
jgi:hypothetical protein